MKVILMIGKNKVELDGVTDIKVEDQDEVMLDSKVKDIIYYKLSCKSEVYSYSENKIITFDNSVILKLLGEKSFAYIMEDSLGNKYQVSANVFKHGLKRVVDNKTTNMLFNQYKINRIIMSEE